MLNATDDDEFEKFTTQNNSEVLRKELEEAEKNTAKAKDAISSVKTRISEKEDIVPKNLVTAETSQTLQARQRKGQQCKAQ